MIHPEIDYAKEKLNMENNQFVSFFDRFNGDLRFPIEVNSSHSSEIESKIVRALFLMSSWFLALRTGERTHFPTCRDLRPLLNSRRHPWETRAESDCHFLVQPGSLLHLFTVVSSSGGARSALGVLDALDAFNGLRLL